MALGGPFRTTPTADLEQELSRPYAYVAQRYDRPGFSVLDLKDLNNIKVLCHRWKIENAGMRQAGDFEVLQTQRPLLCGRAACFQFRQSTPDGDLGAIIFDVTGLPDTSKGEGRQSPRT